MIEPLSTILVKTDTSILIISARVDSLIFYGGDTVPAFTILGGIEVGEALGTAVADVVGGVVGVAVGGVVGGVAGVVDVGAAGGVVGWFEIYAHCF